MAGELDAALVQLHKILTDNLQGLRQAPIEPPNQANAFPFMVLFSTSGSWTGESGGVLGIHNVVIQIHNTRQNLPIDYGAILPYGEKVKDILMAPNSANNNYNLNSTIDYFDPHSVSYEFGPLEWAEIPTIGWTFTVAMHIQSIWSSGAYVKG